MSRWDAKAIEALTLATASAALARGVCPECGEPVQWDHARCLTFCVKCSACDWRGFNSEHHLAIQASHERLHPPTIRPTFPCEWCAMHGPGERCARCGRLVP